MAAAAGRSHHGEDRIGALDDELLREIISRLPITDAARTTTFASRWRHLWHSIPLHLNDAHLPETARAAAVDRVLSGHPGPFRYVRLVECRFGPQDQDHVRWLRLLAAKGIQRLFLFNRGQTSLRLPADFFRCSSLKLLILGSWTFPDEHLPDIFPKLRTLSLSRVSMTDQDLDHLLAASPLWEALFFICNRTPQRIHLRSQSLCCVLITKSTVAEEVAAP